MTRYVLGTALALGAVLSFESAVSADEREPARTPSTTMTLGGKGTAAQAATEDTELARGYGGGHYGGYRGWGGGYGGYRGYYGGGYYTGYRGYYGGGYGGYYRPAYYYTPRVYYPSYYGGYSSYPVYSSYYGGCAPSVGFTFGISGASAQTVPLSGLSPAPVPQPMGAPVVPGGTFKYDGGPSNPVPLPQTDPQAIPPANPNDLPVSLKPKAATTPYKYKAYGEK